MRTTAAAPLADIATEATLAFPDGVTASIVASALSFGFDLRATCAHGTLVARNFLSRKTAC